MDNILISDIVDLDKAVEADAWIVEKALGKLAEAYEKQVRDEWLDFAGAVWHTQGREDKDKLTDTLKDAAIDRIAASRSTWSGGSSIKNMCEQIQREVALDWAKGLTFRITDKCLNEAADRAEIKEKELKA